MVLSIYCITRTSSTASRSEAGLWRWAGCLTTPSLLCPGSGSYLSSSMSLISVIPRKLNYPVNICAKVAVVCRQLLGVRCPGLQFQPCHSLYDLGRTPQPSGFSNHRHVSDPACPPDTAQGSQGLNRKLGALTWHSLSLYSSLCLPFSFLNSSSSLPWDPLVLPEPCTPMHSPQGLL